MKNYNKTSTALKIVQSQSVGPVGYNRALRKHASARMQNAPLADVRKELRAEAKMLTATAYALLVLGVIGIAVLCTVNGYIYHTLVNEVSLSYANMDAGTAIAIFIALGVGGFLFAALCVFMALVLFGVADTLRQEAKKIK